MRGLPPNHLHAKPSLPWMVRLRAEGHRGLQKWGGNIQDVTKGSMVLRAGGGPATDTMEGAQSGYECPVCPPRGSDSSPTLWRDICWLSPESDEMQVVFGKTIPEFITMLVLCICPWNGALGVCLSLGKGHFLCQKPASRPHISYVKMLRRNATPLEN